MLTLALAATLIGFGLLVVALVTSQFWLAVASIVVCVLGLIILLIDAVRSGRRSVGIDDEPLFHIRGESGPRKRAPASHLDDDTDGDEDDDYVPARPALRRPPSAATGGPDTGGLGSLVAPPPGMDPGGPAAPVLRSSPASGPITDANTASGNADDYIRSVTGSLPSFGPSSGPLPSYEPSSGPWPAASSPRPGDVTRPPVPGDVQRPPVAGPPVSEDYRPAPADEGAGPIPADNPYVGRRRLGGGEWVDPKDAVTGETPPVTSGPQHVIRAPHPASDFYGDDDGIVVQDNTGPLPSITYRTEDHD
ncbi:MAG: hypothetical protein QM658_06825 [Gordonia sp. (in: high G+C Gram-positive bacteria)]